MVPSLEPYSAPAFYLTTPLGDSDNNVIYINRRNSPQGLELYTTLAHEGFPGHLYQTVYSSRIFSDMHTDPARKLIWYGGYLEGWALYVEFLSYDYAATLLEQAGQSDAAQSARLEKHTRSLQLCMYTLLDLLIHGEGAGYDQVAEVLGKFGIDSPGTCEASTLISQKSPVIIRNITSVIWRFCSCRTPPEVTGKMLTPTLDSIPFIWNRELLIFLTGRPAFNDKLRFCDRIKCTDHQVGGTHDTVYKQGYRRILYPAAE